MAHHSSQFDPAIAKLFETTPRRSQLAEAFEQNERRGPTGQFPDGKLTPSDEGETRVGITHMDGRVVVDFGTPTAWIGFTPEQADYIAELLIKHAAEIRATAAGGR